MCENNKKDEINKGIRNELEQSNIRVPKIEKDQSPRIIFEYGEKYLRIFLVAFIVWLAIFFVINPWVKNDFELHKKELELNDKKAANEYELHVKELELNEKKFVREMNARNEERRLNFTVQSIKMASSSGLVQKLFPSQRDLVSLFKDISFEVSYEKNDSTNASKYEFAGSL